MIIMLIVAVEYHQITVAVGIMVLGDGQTGTKLTLKQLALSHRGAQIGHDGAIRQQGTVVNDAVTAQRHQRIIQRANLAVKLLLLGEEYTWAAVLGIDGSLKLGVTL